MITWSVLAAGCAIAAAAAALRRLTGMGFAMVAVAFLSLLIRPSDAVLVTLILQLVLGARNARLIISDTCWNLLPWIMIAGLIAAPFGLVFTHLISEYTLRLIIGACILLGLLPVLFRRAPKAGPSPVWTAIVSGSLAGFLNSIAAMPAPPLLFYLMGLPKIGLDQRRATLITIFTLLSVASLAARLVSGDVDSYSLVLALALCPATLIGNYLGSRTPWSFHRGVVDFLSIMIVVISAATLILSTLYHGRGPADRRHRTALLETVRPSAGFAATDTSKLGNPASPPAGKPR